jgi:phosphopantothenoylcysteine synthetase/decarboxylase
MKTFITALTLVTVLSTPALAEKTLVNPKMSECTVRVELLQEQILRMKKELAILAVQSNSQHKKILKDQEKAG